ncbi:hypothetical protein L798_01063 [Zootermopsis nevadensis]|uniref:Uncharacterized protein n=1 Tax=Zootermopsis nevadensis TaxID=136037 RepID=A0A067QJT2_ZOONE|nr:hypothetical protein L798_01063 [Zootermopsis nevadensis]
MMHNMVQGGGVLFAAGDRHVIDRHSPRTTPSRAGLQHDHHPTHVTRASPRLVRRCLDHHLQLDRPTPSSCDPHSPRFTQRLNVTHARLPRLWRPSCEPGPYSGGSDQSRCTGLGRPIAGRERWGVSN